MFEYNEIMSVAFIISGLLCAIIFRGRIPNFILILLALAMPVTGYLCGMEFSEIGTHVAIGAAGFVLAMLGFMFIVPSGGLWKSLAVVILWLPLEYLMPVLLTLLAAGFVLSLGDVLLKKLSSTKESWLLNRYAAIQTVIAGVILAPSLQLPVVY